MRTMGRIGIVLLIGGLLMIMLGLTGISETVPALVMGLVLTMLGGVIGLIGRGIAGSFDHQIALVNELSTRGVRKQGTVEDIVPYATPHGGAVFQAQGTQLVVRIALAEGRRVTCHLVENTEQARGRIGKPIVVIEHPEEPSMRAIEGYKPNGLRA